MMRKLLLIATLSTILTSCSYDDEAKIFTEGIDKSLKNLTEASKYLEEGLKGIDPFDIKGQNEEIKELNSEINKLLSTINEKKALGAMLVSDVTNPIFEVIHVQGRLSVNVWLQPSNGTKIFNSEEATRINHIFEISAKLPQISYLTPENIPGGLARTCGFKDGEYKRGSCVNEAIQNTFNDYNAQIQRELDQFINNSYGRPSIETTVDLGLNHEFDGPVDVFMAVRPDANTWSIQYMIAEKRSTDQSQRVLFRGGLSDKDLSTEPGDWSVPQFLKTYRIRKGL